MRKIISKLVKAEIVHFFFSNYCLRYIEPFEILSEHKTNSSLKKSDKKV